MALARVRVRHRPAAVLVDLRVDDVVEGLAPESALEFGGRDLDDPLLGRAGLAAPVGRADVAVALDEPARVQITGEDPDEVAAAADWIRDRVEIVDAPDGSDA